MFVFNVPGVGPVRVAASSQAEARLKLAQLLPQKYPNIAEDAITNAVFMKVDNGTPENQGVLLEGQGAVGFDPTVSDPEGPGPDLSFEAIRNNPALARGTFNNALREISPKLDPNGVLAGSLQGQFSPTALITSFNSLLGLGPEVGDAPGATEQGFRDVLQGGNTGGQLMAILNRLGSVEEGAPGSNFRNPEITSTTGQSTEAQRLQEIARQAAVSKFGGLAASLLPSQQRVNQGFDDQLASTNLTSPPSYFDYVRRTFGV